MILIFYFTQNSASSSNGKLTIKGIFDCREEQRIREEKVKQHLLTSLQIRWVKYQKGEDYGHLIFIFWLNDFWEKTLQYYFVTKVSSSLLLVCWGWLDSFFTRQFTLFGENLVRI